jgi:DNA sulfur modification protein DndC
LKIDPVNALVKQRVGHWGEAILHLGARRAESSTRAQTMAARPTRNGLRRHPDLPRVRVSNPIEFLSTEEVWAYLLQNPNPWGGDNRPLYELCACGRAEQRSAQAERCSALHASASNGECPIQIVPQTYPSADGFVFGFSQLWQSRPAGLDVHGG